MPVRITNFAQNTISFQLKSTSKTELKIKQMNNPPVGRKERSDFPPLKKMTKNAHLLPLRERLTMYRLGSAAGDFSPRVPKQKKKVKSKKPPKSMNLKLIPAVTLQLPSRYSLSPAESEIIRRTRDDCYSAIALEESSILEPSDDDIETLVQKFPIIRFKPLKVYAKMNALRAFKTITNVRGNSRNLFGTRFNRQNNKGKFMYNFRRKHLHKS